MELNVVIEEHEISVSVPENTLRDADEFFRKMDRDMDQGWQMSREWVDRPSTIQRCQIAADKLHTALANGNQTMVTLMAGYILSRLPNVRSVHVNTDGDIQDTEFVSN